MISNNGRKIIERFVGDVKSLLTENVTAQLNSQYGIWSDGTTVPVSRLTTKDGRVINTARLLRQRLDHIKSNLPDGDDRDVKAVRQLTSEQAFTILNRFCALRMSEERELIPQSIGAGFDSEGFQSYDMVTGKGRVGSQFDRYNWYLSSMMDELSVELPSIFDRWSPYGLIYPDESTLRRLFKLINAEQLTDFYDEATGETVNFWKENETLGWIFQYYNSDEERKKMREESGRPRNSREMAVRNQFFTPDYVVRFLTDNSLGRIWYEMTAGRTALVDVCKYMIRRPDETIPQRKIKEPTELLMLDPACGSMHFGLYSFDVFEAIYMDAWDHQPELLRKYRYEHSRESFQRLVPKLILEHNIHGTEIDPRALQIAALSLWLRAQQSWSEQGISREERPVIERSNLVLAEPMPGNKRLLNLLISELDKPMQKLISKVWDKMRHVDEAGMLIRIEKEIAEEISELEKNWDKVNRNVAVDLFTTEESKEKIEEENRRRQKLRNNKEAFFADLHNRLQTALHNLSMRLGEEESYANTLFANDAARGFAFIELCQKRYDCILMNPPFGEGSEATINYMCTNYSNWCYNLVCAFIIRMQELIGEDGIIGVLFDRTVMIRGAYEKFRRSNLCGYLLGGLDSGWGVLDANVETCNLLIQNKTAPKRGIFIDILDDNNKNIKLLEHLKDLTQGRINKKIHIRNSMDFLTLPNSIIGYYFDENILKYFRNKTLEERDCEASVGFKFYSEIHGRLYYELPQKTKDFIHRYNGGNYTLFYSTYREMSLWYDNGNVAMSMPNFRTISPEYQTKLGVGYGNRGDILDAHILKKGFYFSHEGLAIIRLTESKSFSCLSYLNSISGQYILNLYTGQHKQSKYVSQLPMPDYESRQKEIEQIVTEIIDIKRKWFSLDETNLEYRGLLAQLFGMTDGETLSDIFNKLQTLLTADNRRYLELVKANDDLWMDLADIAEDSEFRATLNAYKEKRPYEELLSIDGATNQNVINSSVMAKEVVMELVGMAFGRWNMKYAIKGEVPEFNGIFDPLPFMPTVSLNTSGLLEYFIPLPMDGIISGTASAHNNLAERVQRVIRKIWSDRADDIEYELCQLIGVDSLQEWFEDMSPNGFFDYHFKRYTKSRRKAPIYWPISSETGEFVYWVYYPRLSNQTFPSIILDLQRNKTRLESEIQQAHANGDRSREDKLQLAKEEARLLIQELETINAMPYIPNQDDGVPVTAAPIAFLFRHKGWRDACWERNKELEKGELDWSHMAYSLFPSRIRQKAKKDWCMALTHGLEELCENKPKPKKTRKSKSDTPQPTLDLED